MSKPLTEMTPEEMLAEIESLRAIRSRLREDRISNLNKGKPKSEKVTKETSLPSPFDDITKRLMEGRNVQS